MEVRKGRKVIKARHFIEDMIKILIGTIAIAIGIDLFLLPSQLSTGGFAGIGTVLYYLFKLPIGTTMFILNIPLFLIAFFKVGRRFFANAIIGTVSLSYFLNVFEKLEPITTDRFLGFLYGSVIVGIGTAIILKARASTGGTELLASIVRSFKPDFKTGSLIVLFDTIIVIINTIFFKDIEVGLYSALAIYIMGKVLDIFFEGIDFTKMLLIISPKWEEISERINKEVRRGVTSLYGEGMYKREERKVLLCVMSRNEIREVRNIIEEVDPSAFVIITNAREVYGEGFKET